MKGGVLSAESVRRWLKELREGPGNAFEYDDGWIWTFPSEEAAMRMQEWLRQQPGCENADLRNDDHYRWPGKGGP